MKALQDIYKSRSKFCIQVLITLMCSVGFYLYVNLQDYEKVIGGVIFQFLASMILGYIISQFVAFYRKNNWKKIWLRIYQFIVTLSILAAILGIIPSKNI